MRKLFVFIMNAVSALFANNKANADEPTIFDASCYTTGQLDDICRLVGIDNPIADKWQLSLSTITNDDLAALLAMRELIPARFAEIEWEEDDAVEYYNDIYREALGGLECLINAINT